MFNFQFHLPILQRFLQKYSWQDFILPFNWFPQTNWKVGHFNILKEYVKNSLKHSQGIFSNRLGHFISKFKLYGYVSIYSFWQQNHMALKIFPNIHFQNVPFKRLSHGLLKYHFYFKGTA